MSFKLIMPMAGNGARFAQNGYVDPKPLISVNGKPMFVCAVENIGLDFDTMIFIVRKEHNIRERVLEFYPNAIVIEISHPTEGAACSVLLADPYMTSDDSIFVSNCDQIIQWDSEQFKSKMLNDGIILTFNCTERDPKWSYAQTDSADYVTRVAEKDPISDNATTGHYYWSKWSTFKNSAIQMINANDRTNNEFYLCPTFNYTINNGGRVIIQRVNEMHGIGTPEDLNAWLNL
jgi:dTDP-glucose pyrophosphorylase